MSRYPGHEGFPKTSRAQQKAIENAREGVKWTWCAVHCRGGREVVEAVCIMTSVGMVAFCRSCWTVAEQLTKNEDAAKAGAELVKEGIHRFADAQAEGRKAIAEAESKAHPEAKKIEGAALGGECQNTAQRSAETSAQGSAVHDAAACAGTPPVATIEGDGNHASAATESGGSPKRADASVCDPVQQAGERVEGSP